MHSTVLTIAFLASATTIVAAPTSHWEANTSNPLAFPKYPEINTTNTAIAKAAEALLNMTASTWEDKNDNDDAASTNTTTSTSIIDIVDSSSDTIPFFNATYPNTNTTTHLTTRAYSRGKKWDKNKYTVWTYTKPGNACKKGHPAQSKHNLRPWMCKSFGWYDRFSEMMFELPKGAEEEGVYCELVFFDLDGCKPEYEFPKSEFDPAILLFYFVFGRCLTDVVVVGLMPKDKKPHCDNQVSDMLTKTSVEPRCWKKE